MFFSDTVGTVIEVSLANSRLICQQSAPHRVRLYAILTFGGDRVGQGADRNVANSTMLHRRAGALGGMLAR